MGELAGLGSCPLAFGDNPDRLCAWCGEPLQGRRRRWCSDSCCYAWADNHMWNMARFAARKRDRQLCVRCGSRGPLEVNHKTPILGRHAENGCHHHLDGLETLCVPCHRIETNRQAAERRAAKKSSMTVAKKSHPAKYPKYVLDRIALHVGAEARHLGRPVEVLDPFAGVGRIHDLPKRIARTTGIEIEPEWAACRERTIPGDATCLPAEWTSHFDALITSPAYGNRLADSHEARDNCAACGGTGVDWTPEGCADAPMFCTWCGRADCTCGRLPSDMRAHNETCRWCRAHRCDVCKGTGLSRRYTYRHSLGRMPSPNSSATLQWGKAYRDLHEKAWQEAHRVTRKYALIIINCKNHIRDKREQTVVEWHAETLRRIGFYIEKIEDLPAPGITHGENSEARVDFERLIIGRRL